MIVTCPESLCRAENDARNERCTRCQTPLRGYVKLLNHRHHLFNQGLTLARTGEFAGARDAFAAIVAWCPSDTEARNALALACISQSDEPAARLHWRKVLEQSPNDRIAREGLAALVPNAASELKEIAEATDARPEPDLEKVAETMEDQQEPASEESAEPIVSRQKQSQLRKIRQLPMKNPRRTRRQSPRRPN